MPGASGRNRLLEFQSPTTVDDGMGNYTEGFTARFRLLAQVTPRLGGETVMAERLSGRQPVTIRIPWAPVTQAIGTDWQAVDVASGAVYQMKSPPANIDQKNKDLEFIAEQGVAA